MKGLILDLRRNPGGLLDQAVGISDLFLEGGEIVSQRGRDARDVERYNAHPGDMTGGLPMVVLIDPGTASAADLEVAATREEAQEIANRAFGFSEASFKNALNADEGKVRKAAHTPAEAPPEGFDGKKDFQLARAEDVLKYGSVAATPKLAPPTARLASILSKSKVAEGKAEQPK